MKRRIHQLIQIIRIFGWKIYGTALVVGLLVGAGLAVWPNKPPLPSAVKNQTTSTIFVPKGSNIKVDRQSAAYDTTRQLLTYKVVVDDTTVTMSEQPAPPQFSDISGYYAQFAQGLKTYDDFDSAQGHVYLIRPNGGSSQAAVLYSSGTLVFAQPVQALSADEWRQYFRSVVVLH